MGSISLEEPHFEVQSALQQVENDPGKLSAIKPHPLGVRPSGNALTSAVNLRASIGTFNILSDETLSSFLEWLDTSSLLALGSTCRALYAFTSNEDLWRNLFIAYVFLACLSLRTSASSSGIAVASCFIGLELMSL